MLLKAPWGNRRKECWCKSTENEIGNCSNKRNSSTSQIRVYACQNDGWSHFTCVWFLECSKWPLKIKISHNKSSIRFVSDNKVRPYCHILSRLVSFFLRCVQHQWRWTQLITSLRSDAADYSNSLLLLRYVYTTLVPSVFVVFSHMKKTKSLGDEGVFIQDATQEDCQNKISYHSN